MAVSKNQELYAYLDQLSTPELEALLQKEAEILSDDPDMAMCILEVMEKREGGLAEADKEDTARAWEEFLSDYATPEGDGLQLYPSENIDGKSETTASEKSSQVKKRCLHIVRRLAVVAAILACAFLLTACSVGGIERFFRMVGSWTAEVFTFENEYKGEVSSSDPVKVVENSGGYASLAEALSAYGITERLIPAIPDEFTPTFIDVNQLDGGKTVFYAVYQNANENYITFQIKKYDVPGASTFEKDATEVTEIMHGNICYYLYVNDNSNCVSWFNGNAECFIDTDLSLEKVQGLIESI